MIPLHLDMQAALRELIIKMDPLVLIAFGAFLAFYLIKTGMDWGKTIDTPRRAAEREKAERRATSAREVRLTQQRRNKRANRRRRY